MNKANPQHLSIPQWKTAVKVDPLQAFAPTPASECEGSFLLTHMAYGTEACAPAQAERRAQNRPLF